MELRHLRYFVAIAEEGSFTRAAERLWIAQPGLSAQIRQLEAELETKLFERHARGVNLTDAGELLLGSARNALAAADHAGATAGDIEAGLVGTVRVGIATGARWPSESALLGAFGRELPDIEITVIESYGGTLLRDLHDGRLDVVLAPSTLASSKLRHLRLGRAPWVVLVGPDHRLAQPGAVAVHDLQGERIVVTGHRDGAAYDRAVAETLLDLGVSPVLDRGGPGDALFAAVAEGTAVALTTQAARWPGELVVRPLDPARQVHFDLLSRDEAPAPALREFFHAAAARAESPGSPVRPVLSAVA